METVREGGRKRMKGRTHIAEERKGRKKAVKEEKERRE